MEEFKNITRENIEEKLLGENLRVNRIISLAICVGPLLFLTVIIFLYQKNLSSDADILQNNVVDEMIMVLLVVALGVYTFFFFFPKIFLKKENMLKQLSSTSVDKNNQLITDPVLKIIILDRTLMIIRLAMLEAISLFGLVILIQSVLSGIIYHNNNYWLLTIPSLILIMVVLSNYISKEKTISRIESDILFSLQNHT